MSQFFKCHECDSDEPCTLTVESCNHLPGVCPFTYPGDDKASVWVEYETIVRAK